MNEPEIVFTKKEMKSQMYMKIYAIICFCILFLIVTGFFRNINLPEEMLYLLFFLVLSFNLWWFPYDTRASHPELTMKEAFFINLRNPAIIGILLAMIIFIPPAVYSLLFM